MFSFPVILAGRQEVDEGFEYAQKRIQEYMREYSHEQGKQREKAKN